MPDTGLPPVVDIGFLPPEDGTGRGQGHFAYTIRPRTGLATATEIRNIGFITFDPLGGGQTFRTDLVDPSDPKSGIDTRRQALVTIDADIPSSHVTPLPATSTTRDFLVAWSGTDSGAGVAGYDVYSRTDGGAWTLWQSNTPATSATFTGEPGRTYGFLSIARDGAGNGESLPSDDTPPDTETSIIGETADRLEFQALDGRGLTLRVFGAASTVWRIQRAPAVTGPWADVGTLVLDSQGAGLFHDPNIPSTTGFYRAARP